MIKTDKFVMSHRPYAINPSSFYSQEAVFSQKGTVRALWFRRKYGVLAVHTGMLRSGWLEGPVLDVHGWLERLTDSRYGGDCSAWWDGERYWSDQPRQPEMIELDLRVLRPAYEIFPAVPEGYDGWWHF